MLVAAASRRVVTTSGLMAACAVTISPPGEYEVKASHDWCWEQDVVGAAVGACRVAKAVQRLAASHHGRGVKRREAMARRAKTSEVSEYGAFAYRSGGW